MKLKSWCNLKICEMNEKKKIFYFHTPDAKWNALEKSCCPHSISSYGDWRDLAEGWDFILDYPKMQASSQMLECNSIETVGFGQGKQNSSKVITKQSFLFVCLFVFSRDRHKEKIQK